MKFGEDFPSFGGELERLVRLAYPECTFEVRDKIACAQFIAGLPGGFVRRILQLEGLISLRTAVERAKVVFAVSERENFSREQRYRWEMSQRLQYLKGMENARNFGRGEEKEFSRDTQKNLHGAWTMTRGARGRVTKKDNERKNDSSRECWLYGSVGHFRT